MLCCFKVLMIQEHQAILYPDLNFYVNNGSHAFLRFPHNKLRNQQQCTKNSTRSNKNTVGPIQNEVIWPDLNIKHNLILTEGMTQLWKLTWSNRQVQVHWWCSVLEQILLLSRISWSYRSSRFTNRTESNFSSGLLKQDSQPKQHVQLKKTEWAGFHQLSNFDEDYRRLNKNRISRDEVCRGLPKILMSEVLTLCKPKARSGNMLIMTVINLHFIKTCKILSAEWFK